MNSIVGFDRNGEANYNPSSGGKRLPRHGMKCLIVGAGRAGRTLAKNLKRVPAFGLVPVGFLDDNPMKRGTNGLPVLGRIADLPDAVGRSGADIVIVAIPGLSPKVFKTVVSSAASEGLAVRYLPSFLAAVERDARVSDLRHLRVDRLLGRDELRVVRSRSRSIVEGHRILVTGAGGSIGSELCRQLAGFSPRSIHFLDHDESNLHRLQMELEGNGLLDRDEIVIADIRDRHRVRQIFRDVRPQVVFHAAAHKHLPLLERHPCEGVKSNILGTKNLAEACIEFGVERFILISTDKAADPTSILGATKRVAEMVLQTFAGSSTKFASVRFGNVLGSRGSLLSILREQIETGESITVTHPDVTRFFMTTEEAVGLVLEAATMADGGETFVLDMGEPVRILDLVHNLAAELHLDVDDFDIRFTGLRSGEKLHEALFSHGEERIVTSHPKIWATLSPAPEPDFAALLDELTYAAELNRAADVRRCLLEMLPEYAPSHHEARAMVAPYPDDF